MTVTIAGAVEGLNGLLSVKGFGSRTVRVEKIQFSVEIYSEEAANSQTKAFYPAWLQDSDFGLELVALTLSERDGFNTWLAGYMAYASTGRLSTPAMTVSVPGRNFSRQAIPTGTLNFGDTIEQQGKAYRTAMVFRGATDPLALTSGSFFKAAATDPTLSAPYYPSGDQKKGAEALDGTIFDTSGGDAALVRIFGSDPRALRIHRDMLNN